MNRVVCYVIIGLIVSACLQYYLLFDLYRLNKVYSNIVNIQADTDILQNKIIKYLILEIKKINGEPI